MLSSSYKIFTLNIYNNSTNLKRLTPQCIHVDTLLITPTLTHHTGILSEPVSDGEAVPRPQDPLLQRRTLPVLRVH